MCRRPALVLRPWRRPSGSRGVPRRPDRTRKIAAWSFDLAAIETNQYDGEPSQWKRQSLLAACESADFLLAAWLA